MPFRGPWPRAPSRATKPGCATTRRFGPKLGPKRVVYGVRCACMASRSSRSRPARGHRSGLAQLLGAETAPCASGVTTVFDEKVRRAVAQETKTDGFVSLGPRWAARPTRSRSTIGHRRNPVGTGRLRRAAVTSSPYRTVRGPSLDTSIVLQYRSRMGMGIIEPKCGSDAKSDEGFGPDNMRGVWMGGGYVSLSHM